MEGEFDKRESVRHMLIACSRWNIRREQLVESVLTNAGLSSALKAAGVGVASNPDMWVRLMLCGPLRKLGEEYEESIAVFSPSESGHL